jgi:hypothetical protein
VDVAKTVGNLRAVCVRDVERPRLILDDLRLIVE